MQLFVTDKGSIYVCPMENESNVLLALKSFAKNIGLAESLVIDSTKSETSAEVRSFCMIIDTNLKILE